MDIIKPNWDIFKTKFSENPQKNFELFCNLLFCKEFDKPFGIFRYKNQAGLETNPITVDDEIVGWQAKFYDTKLSDNKADLIGTIEKAKKYYPNINRIVFYTNKDWGQGKNQNKSQIQLEVEQKATEEGIKLDWRTAYFFESTFVTIDNSLIAKHFFSLDKSIITVIEGKEEHTEFILNEIQTEIEFNTQKIEIDRSKALEDIEENLMKNKY